jgi:predicted dehydrogenase
MTGKRVRHPFPLRGAVVGFGNAAIHAHLPLWQENDHFRVDAVAEPCPERAELVKNLLPEARIYPGIECLLANEDLDFVDICTPPCFHAHLALAACQSGLHVFCEKPLVTSRGSFQDIQLAVKKHQRVVFTVNNWKYAPLWAKAIELIREENIGLVREISIQVLRPPNSGGGASNWRRCYEVAGGGILVDHGWHHFYLVLAIMGGLPTAISAKMAYPKGHLACLEDTADLVLRFPKAEARMHLTWRASSRENSGHVKGDRGELLINDDHLILRTEGCTPTRFDFPEALSGGSHHLEWMKPVIEDFHREVMDVRARGRNLIESKWCAHLTCLAYRSQQEDSRFILLDEPVE